MRCSLTIECNLSELSRGFLVATLCRNKGANGGVLNTARLEMQVQSRF